MANNQGNGRAQHTNIVSYHECQRNYSAILGHYNFDGCREFLKAGIEGTSRSFFCANCGCHRNYHRRVEVPPQEAPPPPPPRQLVLGLQNHPIPVPATQQQQQEGENPNTPPVADPEEGQGVNNVPERQQPTAVVERRRGRPRVSEVQRQALVSYAQRSNWSLEGRDEEEIVEFCSEVGITSRFLNDWMKRNRRKYGGG